MSARDAILSRIRAALAGEPESSPPGYELWPAGTWPEPPDLAARFFEELARVQGEGRRCGSLDEARKAVAELFEQLGRPQVGLVERSLTRAAVTDLPADHVVIPPADADPRRLAELPLAVLPAEFALADTGSVVLQPRHPAERLLCYLPTVAVVIAQTSQLVAHLSDIWDQVSQRLADPSLLGETLLVTGPSRTADIEKKLVLGAHGPKRLVVLLVDGSRLVF